MKHTPTEAEKKAVLDAVFTPLDSKDRPAKFVIPPCACVHHDATDCARIRDGFDTDDERYEQCRRKCECDCHSLFDDSDEG